MPQIGMHHAGIILVCDFTNGAASSIIHDVEDWMWCNVHVTCHVSILGSERYQKMGTVQKLSLQNGITESAQFVRHADFKLGHLRSM